MTHEPDATDLWQDDFLGTYQVTSHRENHQQGSPVPCSDPGEEIQPDDRQWSRFDVPESDCTLEAADALVGTADCQDVIVWVGTRI